jgi:deoxyribodipyrimidine photolyase-related protein
MDFTLIYPNQLFYNHPALSKNRRVLLVQDPLFFGDEEFPISFHKQKILLHLLSIEQYSENLIKRGFNVIIIEREALVGKNYIDPVFRKFNISSVHICDVVDFKLEQRISLAIKRCKVSINWYQSPGFILSDDQVKNEFSNKKRHSMSIFYKKQRRRLNILMDKNNNPVGGKWSYDHDNRKKLPKKIKIPTPINFNENEGYILTKTEFIKKIYTHNPGSLENFNYPINRAQAMKSFEDFLNNRFHLFGDYEDAIDLNESTLFHSTLTPYLNIGLITPSEIVKMTLDFNKDHPIPINSLEGFIRQIIGWREFIRGVYQTSGVQQRTTNYWKFNKKIPVQFYNGETGFHPVDQIINRVNKYAYSHHIERLMVLGNIMVLLELDPDEVYKWFMELFIDSYDWVMVPNVYGMSQYADGGVMSTKPYISGSNYILKMSNYKRGDWADTWDSLYWNFIDNHRDFFLKNHRMSMMVHMYDKKDELKKRSYKDLINKLNF